MSLADGHKWFGPPETLALIVLAALSISVFLHSLQLPDLDAYRHSPLIVIEVLGLIGALMLVPVFFVRAMYLLVCRRFRHAIVNAILSGASMGVAMWAMWYDSPTLIHMT